MKVIREFLKTASDEEVLEAMFLFLDQRVELSTQALVDPGEKDQETMVFTHESMTVRSGDLFFSSTPTLLDWPLTPVKPTIGELN